MSRENTTASQLACLLTKSLQVLFHLSLKKNDGGVLQTSRFEEGGSGVPQACILGKGKRLPCGWEIAIQGKHPGDPCLPLLYRSNLEPYIRDRLNKHLSCQLASPEYWVSVRSNVV